MRAYGDSTLPAGIRSRFVDNVNGLRIHVLEAGHETAGRPVLLLLHGFPELAYSWRKIMLPLAGMGYRVLAPDQRGYGRTTGSDDRYQGDLGQFRMTNLARDMLGLLAALDIPHVEAVIGHDFGASVAGWSALLRPDVFRALVLMSAPFTGAPSIPTATDGRPLREDEVFPNITRVGHGLSRLDPPRKHYQTYYCTPQANDDMMRSSQGLHAFLRAYYHQKSADWAGNRIHPLSAWTAEEIGKLPSYYVMGLEQDMPEAVAASMPSAVEIAGCKWLPDNELAVYAREYARIGFQGGLNWYRSRLDPQHIMQDQLYTGLQVRTKACFIAGASDWGVHQSPGALKAMETRLSTDWRGLHLVPGAGHWVQQEQPEAVLRHLQAFLA